VCQVAAIIRCQIRTAVRMEPSEATAVHVELPEVAALSKVSCRPKNTAHAATPDPCLPSFSDCEWTRERLGGERCTERGESPVRRYRAPADWEGYGRGLPSFG
jgi:hypothetical protein